MASGPAARARHLFRAQATGRVRAALAAAHERLRSGAPVEAARLYQMADQKRKAELDHLTGDKKEIAFGSQIRSYVFAPYQLIKDHRTNLEIGNVDAVMDGEIDPFIEAFLFQALK